MEIKAFLIGSVELATLSVDTSRALMSCDYDLLFTPPLEQCTQCTQTHCKSSLELALIDNNSILAAACEAEYGFNSVDIFSHPLHFK